MDDDGIRTRWTRSTLPVRWRGMEPKKPVRSVRQRRGSPTFFKVTGRILVTNAMAGGRPDDWYARRVVVSASATVSRCNFRRAGRSRGRDIVRIERRRPDALLTGSASRGRPFVKRFSR